MPIIKSAIKKMKRDEVRRKNNTSKKKKNHELVKQMKKILKKGDKEKATELLTKYHSSVDKLAKKNIIHQNKAARLKSATTLKVNKLKAKK